MSEAPAPLQLRAYSGRENGLMVIGSPAALHLLGGQLLDVGRFSFQKGGWPPEVSRPVVLGPYVDAPDFQLSFHVAAKPPVEKPLPLVRHRPHPAVVVCTLALALVGLVSIVRWAASHVL